MTKMLHRTEASNEVSEFNLTEAGKEKVKLDDLIRSLKKTASQVSVKKQLKNATSKRKLQVPLSKPEADRIKRGVAYEKVSEEVTKWDNIVQAARTADQIVYPLKKPELTLECAEEVVKRYQSKNALEEEVSKLLNSSENVLNQDKELTVAEEKALKAMSLAEAKARHEELKKIRVLLSFKEAKARRQKKIKSKKYHRILKKEKMKKMMKEFEELQKTDPEAAQDKLQEADKLRILERTTLKHKSTGKWAKYQKLRAKYNPESRIALKEQLTISKALTEKVLPVEKEVEEDPIESIESREAEDEEEDDDLLKLYTMSLPQIHIEKPVPNKAITKPAQKISNGKQLSVTTTSSPTKSSNLDLETHDSQAPVEIAESDDDDEDMVDETTVRKTTLEDFEDMEDGDTSNVVTKMNHVRQKKRTVHKTQDIPNKSSGVYVSETDFSTEMKFLDSMVPDEVTFGDEDIDDAEEDRMNIEQAFADEDFISEFKEDKKAIEIRDKPQGINLLLPGWGSWGGAGIKINRRKRKRFYVKPVDVPVRKDSGLSNVIINEEKDKKASVHQVTELPFPFKHVDQFESIIRHPIGSTWIPETSHQKLIAPSVVTKIGKIINPIDPEDVIFEKKSKTVSEPVQEDANTKKRKQISRSFKSKQKKKSNKKSKKS